MVVTGLLLYHFIGDLPIEAYTLGKYYRQRGLPVIIFSTFEPDLANWPSDLTIFCIKDLNLRDLLKTLNTL